MSGLPFTVIADPGIPKTQIFMGPVASTDRHVCRCREGVHPCVTRPTQEDGLCDICRSGCDIQVLTGHLRYVGDVSGESA